MLLISSAMRASCAAGVRADAGVGVDAGDSPRLDGTARSTMREPRKISEGAYGEVFRAVYMPKGRTCAFKVVPTGGDVVINGSRPCCLDSMRAEVIITRQMAKLRAAAPGFIEVLTVVVCRGQYPNRLLRLWDDWDGPEHRSENDRPDAFGCEQLYVVFVFADGGRDLERFEFTSADHAKTALAQVCVSLAAAEQACAFEHRDLHWGNVLISDAADSACVRGDSGGASPSGIFYLRDGRRFRVRGSDAVRASIIDFTLSRMESGTMACGRAWSDRSRRPHPRRRR